MTVMDVDVLITDIVVTGVIPRNDLSDFVSLSCRLAEIGGHAERDSSLADTEIMGSPSNHVVSEHLRKSETWNGS